MNRPGPAKAVARRPEAGHPGADRPSRHLLAVFFLVAVAAARWPSAVTAPQPVNDEMAYFAAFERVATGETPYDGTGYLYPPSLAYAGAWLVEKVGVPGTLAVVRGLNLTGLAVAVWCSFALLAWSWRWRLAAAAAYLCLAPLVHFGVVLGNLSFAVAGMIVLGLALWSRFPLSSGVLLGASIAIKPLAPLPVLLLAIHRPRESTRRHLLAGASAAAVAAILLLASPHLDEMVRLHTRELDVLARSVSLQRLALLAGWRQAALPIFALAALAATLLGRRRRLDRRELVAASVAIAVAATPVAWSHTLLLTLPLQVAALIRLIERRRRAIAESVRRRRRLDLEAVLVVGAVLSLQLAEGATDLYDQALAVQWLGALLPAIAPLALAGYYLATARTPRSPAGP